MAGDMLLMLGLVRLRPRAVQTQALAAYSGLRAVATGNIHTAPPLKEQVCYMDGYCLAMGYIYI